MCSPFQEELLRMGACRAAIDWAGERTREEAWRDCHRADWMFWYAARTKCDRGKLVLAACACARTALPYAKGPEALAAIEAAEAWCRGEATLKDVREARQAVYGASRTSRSSLEVAEAVVAAVIYTDWESGARAVVNTVVAAAYASSQTCAGLVRRIISVGPGGTWVLSTNRA